MRSHKGFSLIEAAIVLGIIGLVIGGIWVAASAVRSSNHVAEIQKDIGHVLNAFAEFRNIRHTDLSFLNGNSLSGLNTAIKMKLLPTDCTAINESGFYYCELSRHRFQQFIYVVGAQVIYTISRRGSTFMSNAECIAIAKSLWETALRYKLTPELSIYPDWSNIPLGYTVNVGGGGGAIAYSIANLTTACIGPTNWQVVLSAQ